MVEDTKIKVGFLGIGEAGLAIARNVINSAKYKLLGYDDDAAPSLEKFALMGAQAARSYRCLAEECSILVCLLPQDRIQQAVFDSRNGALFGMRNQTTLLVCSSIDSAFHEDLASRLDQFDRRDLQILDCSVVGGIQRAVDGSGPTTMIVSGPKKGLADADALLHTLSANIIPVLGGAGSASNYRLVLTLLEATHIAAAAEATALADRAGLDLADIYDIICSAAGSSNAFETRVPRMLQQDWSSGRSLDSAAATLATVISSSAALKFPLPVASAAEQLYILARSAGYGRDGDAGLRRIFSPPALDHKQETKSTRHLQNGDHQPVPERNEVSKIGMIGLGAMGQGMAASMLKAGYPVHGYDVFAGSVEKFLSYAGPATAVSSPAEAANGAQILVIMVQNAGQVNDALFGAGDAATRLADGAVIMLSSTVSPDFVRSLQERLDGLRKGLRLLDAPVSGGVARAANGTLTIICSGQESVVSSYRNVLHSMTGGAANLRYVRGGVGAASCVKCVNQLLAGIHIVAAAEAMAFGARLNLDPKVLFDLVTESEASSWMFSNRVPQVLSQDWTPHSALAIFVKDMGIVLKEARRLQSFCPLSAVAHNLYLSAAAHGMSLEADIGVVRLWAMPTFESSGADNV